MKKFWLDTLLATIFIFIVMIGVYKITDLKVFNAFDPISNALADFELSDYGFSHFRPEPDSLERSIMDQIVLVNIGELDRRNFAQLYQNIVKYKPRAIGIDSYFDCEGGHYTVEDCPPLADTLGNLMLAGALQSTPNLVLVSKLLQTDSLSALGDIDFFDSLEVSDEMFRANAHIGFANLVTDADYQEDVKICKSFVPKRMVGKREELAFAVKVAMLYDSVKTKKFLARNNPVEVVNYKGNFELEDVKLANLKKLDLGTTDKLRKLAFFALDVDDVMQERFDSTAIKDKVVLFGYLGRYFGDPDWMDKFFTPLNKKIGGRANPDMFGLVIHANIIAMILSEDYIDELSTWQEGVIAFIICFFNVALFSVINRRWPLFYDGVSVIIQVIEIVICSIIVVFLLGYGGFKSSLGITMGALALVGPCYDIYAGLLKAGTDKLKEIWLTRKQKRVLKT
ncbi:MAG TPA: CHASE2 domain-containing protein [Cyclobacteriaceae bacterium]